MFLIAQNNFQLIVEFAIALNLLIILIFNILPLTLTLVLLIALVLSVGLTLLFGFGALSLFLPSTPIYEFTHPYGAIALLAIITSIAAIYILEDMNELKTRRLKNFLTILIILITLVGGLVHRDFLGMWILGLIIGFFLLSKSFQRKAVLTIKRLTILIIAALSAFSFFQLLSVILNAPVISPLLRLNRLYQYSVSSITLVIQNTHLIGHNPLSSYWGVASTGFADGYISLPLTFIKFLGLPFPEFYGALYNRKDVIDYFVPGIMGYSYDFGYIIMFLFLAYTVGIILIGLHTLRKYRKEREQGNKNLLGREALLIGSLTAFISLSLVGFFLQNRDINGTALIEFLFLSALILAQLFITRNNRI